MLLGLGPQPACTEHTTLVLRRLQFSCVAGHTEPRMSCKHATSSHLKTILHTSAHSR